MRRSEKNWMTSDDNATASFLAGDTDAAATAAAELRDRVVKVEQQVLSQYTAMAAYATLGQKGVEEARAEARADLDRSQNTIIGLLDRLRADIQTRLDGMDTSRGFAAGGGGGGSGTNVDARLAAMEDRINGLIRALEGSVHENMQLRQQIEELQQKMMQQDGWLVADGGPSDLTMH